MERQAYKMLDHNEYKVNLPYPKAPEKPEYHSESSYDQTMDQMLDKIDEYRSDVCAYHEKMKVYLQKYNEYKEEETNLRNKFRLDVLKEYGLIDHPKADILYHLASEIGLTDSTTAVETWVRKLSVLLRD